jgi:Uma2 family endonuclease
MATVLAPSTERVVLHDIGWERYESLLADYAERGAHRLTYDEGTLEIMSPLEEHEESNRTINLLVEVVAEEREIEIRNLGSTTFKRQDLAKGFEADSCFYIQNVERVRGKKRIDLLSDPPPDLVIEIEISSPSLPKLPIYAQLGIPEVWRYDGQRLHVLLLENGDCRESAESLALPGLTGAVLTELLQASENIGRRQWLRNLREWLRGQRQG